MIDFADAYSFVGTPQGWPHSAGKYMRHVKVRPGVAIDGGALRRLIEVAYADIQWRVEND